VTCVVLMTAIAFISCSMRPHYSASASEGASSWVAPKRRPPAREAQAVTLPVGASRTLERLWHCGLIEVLALPSIERAGPLQ
jgi:hypothetical protein